MIRSLWISKTGLDAQQTQMDVIANNLANVSTTGFKRSRAVFEDLLYQTIRQPGAQSSQQTQIPSGLQIGTGVRPVAAERIHTQGNLQLTGNQLDVAIQGAGFFQVLMPDGTTAYTRDGSFQTDRSLSVVMFSEMQLMAGSISLATQPARGSLRALTASTVTRVWFRQPSFRPTTTITGSASMLARSAIVWVSLSGVQNPPMPSTTMKSARGA